MQCKAEPETQAETTGSCTYLQSQKQYNKLEKYIFLFLFIFLSAKTEENSPCGSWMWGWQGLRSCVHVSGTGGMCDQGSGCLLYEAAFG